MLQCKKVWLNNITFYSAFFLNYLNGWWSQKIIVYNMFHVLVKFDLTNAHITQILKYSECYLPFNRRFKLRHFKFKNFCLIAGTPSSHLGLDALIKGTVKKKTHYNSLISLLVPGSPLLFFELVAFASTRIFNYWSTTAIKHCPSLIITHSNCHWLMFHFMGHIQSHCHL